MDIFDIILRRQVHDLALQGGSVILEDTAPGGAYRQRSLIVGVSHIVRQVDAAAAGIGALDVDTALFRANQANNDIVGCVHIGPVGAEAGFAYLPPVGFVLEPAKETGTAVIVRKAIPTLTQGIHASIQRYFISSGRNSNDQTTGIGIIISFYLWQNIVVKIWFILSSLSRSMSFTIPKLKSLIPDNGAFWQGHLLVRNRINRFNTV